MNGQHPFWLLLVGIAALGVLLWINQQQARHFHRRINRGIALAAIIVLGVTLVAVIGAGIRDNSNDRLRDGDLALAVAQANARTAANDAKANESLALIKRGSGARFTTAWGESAEVVEKSLRRDTGDSWSAYVAVHKEIQDLDESGNWEKARDLATTSNDTGSSKPLTEFNNASEQIVETAGDAVKDDLRSGRLVALIISLLTLLLGVVAAASVSRGIGERRKEFS